MCGVCMCGVQGEFSIKDKTWIQLKLQFVRLAKVVAAKYWSENSGNSNLQH